MFFYAQKTNALQQRKILLLRQSSFNKRIIRKIYFKRTIVENSIVEKLEFYRQLQETFNHVNFLVHFNSKRILYIDIDVSKRRDFDAMIYYIKIENNTNKFKRKNIEFILFLSRMLSDVEIKY